MTKPYGVFAIAVFFALATCIVLGVGTALLLPGSALEAVWTAYPARRALLMPYRVWLGPGFLALAGTMAGASLGCFLRRKWGWRLAVAIFAVNGLGDLAQFLSGHVLEGAVGVTAASAILYYLWRPMVRAAFV